MVKVQLEQLAIFGAAPAFAAPLHVGRPNIGDQSRFLGRVAEILDRRWLTNNGPCVQELETRIAKLVGVRHCVAMCNATGALEIAVRAAGLTGQVIVPSFTFVATAHALQWQQITPVFCDIDPATHNLDPDQVERLITPQTTGIIGVHLWGRACAVEALEAIARRRGLTLLFDAAHAFACAHRGRMVGSFGAAEVFSFHATKFFNTFEGGAFTTNNDDLAEKARLMRNFGFTGYDQVVAVGTNGKMSEVCAAMGLTGLESLDQFMAVNQRNHTRYQQALAGLPGLTVLTYDPQEQHNHQYVVVEIDGDAAGLDRDQLVDVLWAENVLVRKYFWPGCHAMEPYRTLRPDAANHLPQTVRLAGGVLLLPTGTAVDAATIDAIAAVIRVALRHSLHVRPQLGRRSVQLAAVAAMPPEEQP